MTTPHVVITGGSSGIGLALAALYLRRGARVSLVARTLPLLEAARDGLASGVPGAAARIAIGSADVTDRDQLGPAMLALEARQGPCDILVASAGMVTPGTFDGQAPDVFERQIAVNLSGVANSIRAVYPGMLSRRAGAIMILSSGAGLTGLYGYSAYCASKFALRGLAGSLRAEARPAGITVSIAFPPDTVTPQYLEELPLRPPEAEAVIGTVRPWPAEAVAAAILAGIDRGRAEVFIGLELHALGRFGGLVRPLLDRWFDRLILRARRKADAGRGS
ncbi:SDR family oxidoreductase [Ensifer soli]|uniref:SDR family oxidoreductase n=1 Tax=Ciceribacter sp. sgz301302 TaxID=3342379 RepID=UPI0035BB6FB5